MDKKHGKKATRGKKTADLSLKTVLELGGNKDDLALVQGIDSDDEEEVELQGEDFESEPVKKQEIKDLLKQLEIHKYRPDDGSTKKEKKKKLLEMPVKDDDEEEDKEDGKQKDEGQEEEIVKTKKKKEKNKFKIQDEEVSSTTEAPGTSGTFDLGAHIRGYHSRKYLLIKPGGECIDEESVQVTGAKTLDNMEKQMENFAAKLLQDEIAVYNKQRENTKKSDVNWIRTVLTSGTLADKMAALTLLVQESPLHNLSHLETLVNMAKKKGKRECMLATDSLLEMFLSGLLPDKRKLVEFRQHKFSMLGEISGGNRDTVDKKLLMWYYEGLLKTKYADFIKALEVMSHDTLLATKQKALNTIFQLLVKKPEQEKQLLKMLINKVGDPNYKLASKASQKLTRLVENHPNMKSIVVKEVEQLLFRPNIPQKAQYYAVCFLHQLSLSPADKELAAKLINIYFSFFKAFVKKGDVDSKMMSALLMGVNRAYPYAKVGAVNISEQMDNLYKLVHVVNFNTSLQALMLLYHVMDSSESVSDRFYTALYKKLSDPALTSSSKQTMFLNLLFKSLKKDVSDRRIKAFLKRLLQVCSYQQPQFICGCLVLMSEVMKTKPGLLMLNHVEEESDEEEHFVDLPDPDDTTASSANYSSDEDIDTEGQSLSPRKPSWIHRRNITEKKETSDYDPHLRNPEYCHAEHECIWELKHMTQHYHPSVALFAAKLLQGEQISYSGDPLQDFTLIRFLDRFVYKNPKKNTTDDKVPVMGKHQSKLKGLKKFAVNTEKFRETAEENVPVDDRFFYRYFKQKAAKEEHVPSDADSDASSVSDTEFDDFLDKYEGQFDDGNLSDFSDLDLDFAGEFGRKKGSKRDRKVSDEDESDDLDDLDNDLSDEEVDFSDDDDFAAAFKDDDDSSGSGVEGTFNEEDIDFSEDDDEYGELDPTRQKKGKKRKSGLEENFQGKKKRSGGGGGLFAAAEEFSHLIDENAGNKLDMIGADAVNVKDKADVKQIKWEMDRDRWLKGKSWKSRKPGKDKPTKGKKVQFHKGHQKNKGGKQKQKPRRK